MGCKKHEEIPVGKSDIAFNRVWMHGWSHPFNRYRGHEENAKFCRTSLRKEDTCKSNKSTAVNDRWKLQFCLVIFVVVCAFVPSASAGLTQFLSVYLSTYRFACLSVRLSFCLCLCFPPSVQSSYSLTNGYTDREHVSMKYSTISISTIAIHRMEFLKSACGNRCQYRHC